MTEVERLKSLSDLDVLDTMPQEEYDQVVRLAAEICSTPISLISLVDADRQWFKARIGLEACETPRSLSFCAHAIQQPEMFVVEDAAKDERFLDNALVTGPPHIRFYAGVPLRMPDGASLGTLCVIDTVPRQLTAGQVSALTILARKVQTRFELRAKQKALEALLVENAAMAAKLEETNNLMNAFLDNAPFVSYMKDAEGRMVYYNRRMNERFGVDGGAWIGRTNEELWEPHAAAQFREHDLKVIASGKPVEFNEVSTCPGAAPVHWKSFKFPFRRASGEVVLAGFSLDVTADLAREKALEETLVANVELVRSLESSEALFRTFMDFIPMHAFLKSQDGRYLFYNRHFAEQVGIGQKDWLGKTDFDVMPRGLAEHFRQSDLQVLSQQEFIELYDELPNRSGEMRKLRGLKFSYLNAKQEKTIAGIVIDMTELLTYKEQLEAANRQLQQLATTDALTGLRNRRVFEERMEIEFEVARRKGRPLSLLVLDLDNFKLRNDQLGHAAGDEALKLFGRILERICRVSDLPARIGGEEFALLLPETAGAAAHLIAERVHASLRAGSSGPHPLTVSIGVASMNPATMSWQRLLACADDAMYVAKISGKDRTVLHHDHVEALLQEARQLASAQPPQAAPVKTSPELALPVLPSSLAPLEPMVVREILPG
jgi:diguanylate cyclase (GGDEF)-like protein/PAS domain S-box-containing protein